jgi:hypothetical protein
LRAGPDLAPAQASKVQDTVRNEYSKTGVPSEEQAKAYIAMLGETAGPA